jgi:hypothetical protein
MQRQIGRKSHFGTPDKVLTGSARLNPFRKRAGSRTLVSNFPAFRRYRFFIATAAQSANAPARQLRKFANALLAKAFFGWRGALGDELEPLRRCACPVPCGAVSGMLLPLRARASPGELREDV